MDFSELLSKHIKAKGWSQNEAGPHLGVAGPFVNQIIKGKRRPPLDRLDLWAKTLGLDEFDAREFKMFAGLAHIKDTAVRQIILEELRRLNIEVFELMKVAEKAIGKLPTR